jgi:hypothetical protein
VTQSSDKPYSLNIVGMHCGETLTSEAPVMTYLLSAPKSATPLVLHRRQVKLHPRGPGITGEHVACAVRCHIYAYI